MGDAKKAKSEKSSSVFLIVTPGAALKIKAQSSKHQRLG
jgi:hypothetical protein